MRQPLGSPAAQTMVWGVGAAGLTFGLMVVGFVSVGILWILAPQLDAYLVFQVVAIVGVFVVPHFIAGFIVGSLRGRYFWPTVLMAVVPLLALLIALLVTGGPIEHVTQSVGAVSVIVMSWLGTGLFGVLVGERADMTLLTRSRGGRQSPNPP